MSKPAVHRKAYVIVLRPELGVDEEQATRALRQILKSALRLHGMRCLSAEPAYEPTSEHDALAGVTEPDSATSTGGEVAI